MSAGTEPPLPRVRITAPRRRGATEPRPLSAGPASDLERLYVRSLIRSQLRLAITSAVSFVIILAAIPIVLAVWPELAAADLAGIRLSWLLLAVGVFPVAIVVAALAVSGASRNEARYRSLAGDQ